MARKDAMSYVHLHGKNYKKYGIERLSTEESSDNSIDGSTLYSGKVWCVKNKIRDKVTTSRTGLTKDDIKIMEEMLNWGLKEFESEQTGIGDNRQYKGWVSNYLQDQISEHFKGKNFDINMIHSKAEGDGDYNYFGTDRKLSQIRAEAKMGRKIKQNMVDVYNKAVKAHEKLLNKYNLTDGNAQEIKNARAELEKIISELDKVGNEAYEGVKKKIEAEQDGNGGGATATQLLSYNEELKRKKEQYNITKGKIDEGALKEYIQTIQRIIDSYLAWPPYEGLTGMVTEYMVLLILTNGERFLAAKVAEQVEGFDRYKRSFIAGLHAKSAKVVGSSNAPKVSVKLDDKFTKGVKDALSISGDGIEFEASFKAESFGKGDVRIEWEDEKGVLSISVKGTTSPQVGNRTSTLSGMPFSSLLFRLGDDDLSYHILNRLATHVDRNSGDFSSLRWEAMQDLKWFIVLEGLSGAITQQQVANVFTIQKGGRFYVRTMADMVDAFEKNMSTASATLGGRSLDSQDKASQGFLSNTRVKSDYNGKNKNGENVNVAAADIRVANLLIQTHQKKLASTIIFDNMK